MCYELWRNERIEAEEKAAKQKAKEMIDKARTAKPAPMREAPVTAGQEMEREKVPA
jgi:hypothetical protein